MCLKKAELNRPGECPKIIRDQGTLRRALPARHLMYQSGDVTTSITQLVKDIRQIMEPHTATRLRVRLIYPNPNSH